MPNVLEYFELLVERPAVAIGVAAAVAALFCLVKFSAAVLEAWGKLIARKVPPTSPIVRRSLVVAVPVLLGAVLAALLVLGLSSSAVVRGLACAAIACARSSEPPLAR